MAKLTPFQAFLLGGAVFVGASYILHCGFGMGPWGCQKLAPGHTGNAVT